MALKSNRLLSLDVLRGLTIVGMIIVNSPGSWAHVYPPLLHAEWHGLTPTDLVFPFFLFMVGVAITLAFSNRIERSISKSAILPKILKRTAILFGLGLFLWLFPKFNWDNIRYPGVLQRIALVYCFASLIALYASKKWQYYWCAGLLLGYWLLMMFVPVPGLGRSTLAPGENLAAWLDSLLIPGRMWRGTWDPEGLLSTLPSVATGLTGVLTGYLFLDKNRPNTEKISVLMVAGSLMLLGGYFWHLHFPVNKNLWSSSYVLVCSGMAMLLLGTLYWFIDVKGHKRFTPFFVAFGSNAITAFVLHGAIVKLMGLVEVKEGTNLKKASYLAIEATGMQPELASLLWAILYVLLNFIPIWIMYKQGVIVKI